MDAHSPNTHRPAFRLVRGSLLCLVSFALTNQVHAAVYRTKNFTVTAPSDSLAREVGITAEKWRKLLAVEWLGKAMPQWYAPCKVRVKVGQIGAGGATTFSFNRGHVYGWNMKVQGTRQRILDSVVPHEVSHTVFASYFRRPLPRWADEGAATLVEHESEKRVQQERLKQAIRTRGRIPIPFRRLLPMKEYPRDMKSVLLLYAEGYSLADYLVQNGGKSRYLRFLNDAYRSGWDKAIKSHYGVSNVETLESKWKEWFLAGSPRLDAPASQPIASNRRSTNNDRRSGIVVRSQTPPAKETVRTASNSHRSPVAPDPRRGGRRITAGSPRTVTTVSEGRRRAINDGWVPIKRSKSSPRKFPRPRSLPAGVQRSPRDARTDWSSFPDRR